MEHFPVGGFSSDIGSGSVLPAPLLDRKLSGFGRGGSRVYTLGTTRGRQTTDVDHESLIACAERPDVDTLAVDKISSKWRMSSNEDDDRLPPASHGRERRRQTNREASQRARQRQLSVYTNVKKRYFDLQCTNTQLNYEALQLRKERDRIRQTLELHRCLLPVSEQDAQKRALASAKTKGDSNLISPVDIKKEPGQDESLEAESGPRDGSFTTQVGPSPSKHKLESASPPNTRKAGFCNIAQGESDSESSTTYRHGRRTSFPELPPPALPASPRQMSTQGDTYSKASGELGVKDEPWEDLRPDDVSPPDHTYAAERQKYTHRPSLHVETATKRVSPSLPLTPVSPSLPLTPVSPSLSLTRVSPSLPLTPVCDELQRTSLGSPVLDLDISPLASYNTRHKRSSSATVVSGPRTSSAFFNDWNPLGRLMSEPDPKLQIVDMSSSIARNVSIPEEGPHYLFPIPSRYTAPPSVLTSTQRGHGRSLSWSTPSQMSHVVSQDHSLPRRAISHPTGRTGQIPRLPEFGDDDQAVEHSGSDTDLRFPNFLDDITSDNSVFQDLDEFDISSSLEMFDSIPGDDLIEFDGNLEGAISDILRGRDDHPTS